MIAQSRTPSPPPRMQLRAGVASFYIHHSEDWTGWSRTVDERRASLVLVTAGVVAALWEVFDLSSLFINIDSVLSGCLFKTASSPFCHHLPLFVNTTAIYSQQHQPSWVPSIAPSYPSQVQKRNRRFKRSSSCSHKVELLSHDKDKYYIWGRI